MTPAFLNSSSPNNNSPFHGGLNEDNHHDLQHHLFFGPYPQVAASSSSYSCHFYFNPTQDQTGYYHHTTEICQPLQQIDQGNGYTSHGGSHESGNKLAGDCVKLSPEIKVHRTGDQADDKNNPAKWMSSKMRLMQKVKNTDCRKGFDEITTKDTTIKRTRQDQKQPSTNSMETDYSINSSSNNSNSTTTTIRVCADCNTTKTPLWRSGPKGPKSLCNACGIRQRKARRALAAAAGAAAAATANDAPQPITETPKVKIKVHHKEKTKNSTGQLTVPFKKRCKVTAGSSNQEPKKLGFEDYLIKLSKNLAFHHVFPQDEKEAAILLMALSCGLVHG